MKHQSPFKAMRLSKEEFQATFGTEQAAKSEAEKFIAEARTEAENLREFVAAEERRLGAHVKSISDEKLREYIDIETLERSVASFAEIMAQAEHMRRDFEAMQPWLTALVETSLRKIIGTFDEADLVSRIVREGMAEMDPRDTITIRVHPDSHAAAVAALTQYPDRFLAVREIGADARLAPGQICLESTGGFSDVSVETQVTALIRELDAAVAEAQDDA